MLSLTRDRLGPNGVRIAATVDHRSVTLLDDLSTKIASIFGIKSSNGLVIRLAVERLYADAATWSTLEPMKKMTLRQQIEAVKHARPRPESAAAAYAQDTAELQAAEQQEMKK